MIKNYADHTHWVTLRTNDFKNRINMKPENLKFLQDNFHHWVTLRDAQYLRGLNGHEREGMQRVLSEEFASGYRTDLWCNSCVTDMVRMLYTLYEKWLAEQSKPDPVELTEPLTVAANFPSHKKAPTKIQK